MLVAGISFAPLAMAKMDGKEAKPFIEAMSVTKQKPMDSTGKSLQSGEFLKSCEAGTFDSVKL